MCTEQQLKIILEKVFDGVKNIFDTNLREVVLFGSYARGDYDNESDIDILVLADVNSSELVKFRYKLDELCGSLLYDFGIVVSIVEKDYETYRRFSDVLPFYKKIKEEGVKIA